MSCYKVAFHKFEMEYSWRNNHLVFSSGRPITSATYCHNDCQGQSRAKTFFLDGKDYQCSCFSQEIVEYDNFMLAHGAPKNCPANIVQNLCVSIFLTLHFFKPHLFLLP